MVTELCAVMSNAAKNQTAVKELIPVGLVVARRGRHWKDLDVTCHLDNQGVATVICSRTGKDPDIITVCHSWKFGRNFQPSTSRQLQ